MNKVITPVFLIVVAVAVFFVYTRPQLSRVKTAQAEEAKYDAALDKADELKEVRADLLKKLGSFDATALSRLEKLLPDNVDNVRLLIEIDSIAEGHGMTLREVSFSQDDNSSDSRGREAASEAQQKPYDSILLSFSVSAPYDDFLLFMHDLEQNLRLVDVESIQFSTSEEGNPSYSVSLRTYWLKDTTNDTL